MQYGLRRVGTLLGIVGLIVVFLFCLNAFALEASAEELTNSNVYYEEGLSGINGNAFLKEDLNSTISHDTTLVYTSDFYIVDFRVFNDKIILIGNKNNKATLVCLNKSYELIAQYSADVEDSQVEDVYVDNNQYSLLYVDSQKSYVDVLELESSSLVLQKSSEENGIYSDIDYYNGSYILLNQTGYVIEEETPVSIANTNSIAYLNSKIYYLLYSENELSLNIKDLNTNDVDVVVIGDTNGALTINNSNIYLTIENSIYKYENQSLSEALALADNCTVYINNGIITLNVDSSISVYSEDLALVTSINNTLSFDNISYVDGVLFASLDSKLYLVSLDDRSVVISEDLTFSSSDTIDYASLATIENVDLTIDSSNVDQSVSGVYNVIYSFTSNGSTYYFYVEIEIITLDGVSDNTLYTSKVTPVSTGIMTLNGESFISGTDITQNGEYNLVVKDAQDNVLYDYTFAIINFENIVDNETYADSVSIAIPEIEELTVKNVDKDSLETILIKGESNALTTEGENTLTLEYKGNTVSYTYYVFVLDGEEDLSSAQFSPAQAATLSLAFTQNTTATVKLNGVEITLGYNDFAYFGTYALVVENANGDQIKNIAFTIDTQVNVGSNVIGFKNGAVYTFNGKAATTYTIIETTSTKLVYSLQAKEATLNGHSAYTGMTTYNAGVNTLTLVGLNGYSVNVTFTINPTTNLINTNTYTGSVLPAISGGVLKLNGAAYTNGTLINAAGDYKLEIFSEANLATAFRTITFTVLPEVLNVTSQDSSNPDVFSSGIILASTNNKMFYMAGDAYTSDENAQEYISNTIISDKSSYVFRMYYITYAGSTHATSAYGYNAEDGIYHIDYYFDIDAELGLNIVDGQEYFNNVTLLFAGVNEATLTYFGTSTEIVVSNGYIVNKIGKYTITLEQGANTLSATFIVSPKLNVENSRAYLSSNNITVVDNGYAFSTQDTQFKLVKETGSTSSNTTTYTSIDDLKGVVLSKGTYQLTITSEVSSYEKIIYFIIIDSAAISRGAIYNNGKSFEFNMYGVDVNIIAPQTGLNITKETTYVEGSNILTVGKHYLTFTFTINGVTTSTDYVLTSDLVFQSGTTYYTKSGSTYEQATVVEGDRIPENTYYILAGTDSATYFYVKPVVEYGVDSESLVQSTATTLTTEESIYMTIKDGSGVDYTKYAIDNKSAAFAADTLYNEIGIHYLTITLDDTSYKITFTVSTSFVEDGNTITETTSAANRLAYLKKATFTTVTPAKVVLDSQTSDITGVEINTIGNHTLTIQGTNGYTKKLYIVINEVVTFNSIDVQSTLDNASLTKTTYSYDNTSVSMKVYGVPESIKINGTAQTLTDDEFTTTKSTVGYYTIVIAGANSYTATYYFTILDDLKINGADVQNTYTTATTIICENTSSMTLKIAKAGSTTASSTFASEDTINTVGEYTIVVNGVGAYSKSYTFAIVNELEYTNSTITTSTTLPASLTSTSAVSLALKNSGVAYASMTRNGVEISTFAKLQTIGEYNFVLVDANNNKYNYSVVISESLLFNGETATQNKYTTKALTNISNADDSVSFSSLKLNGTSVNIADLTNISILGNNSIEIKTVDGDTTYKKVYTLVIEETITGSNIFKSENAAKASAYEEDDAVSYTFNNSELTYKGLSLDGATETYNGESITSYGLHKIVVSGVNGYSVKYYVFVSLNTSLIDNATYLFTSSDLSFTSNAISYALDEDSDAVDAIGIHYVTFNGQNNEKTTYTITVTGTMSLAEGEYKTAISPKANGIVKDVTVDVLSQYTNGVTLLDTVGTYTLTVHGSNNYEAQYVYTLTDSLKYTSTDTHESIAINPDDKITERFAIYLDHTSTTLKYANYELNGDSYATLPEIELIGTNVLVLTDINGNSDTYYFMLGSDIWYSDDDVQEQALKSSQPVVSTSVVTVAQVTTDIYYSSYTLNGVTVPVSQLLLVTIDTIGDNILVVKDINGKESTYSIKITETSDSTFDIYKEAAVARSNAYEYDENVYASFGNKLKYSLKLDGKTYQKGDAITTYGLHTITVVGANGYESDYYQYINLHTSIEDNKAYYETVRVTSNALISADFDNAFNGGNISTIGNHNITFASASSSDSEVYTIKIRETSIGSTLYASAALAKSNPYEVEDNANADFGRELTYTMQINGVEYSVGSAITTYGYHALTVVGFNYVSEEYYVFIELKTTIDSEYTTALSPISNADYYSVDNSIANMDSALSAIGNHTITFYGTSVDSIEIPSTTYNFTIKETNIGSTLYNAKAIARSNAYKESDNAYANFGSDLTYTLRLDGSAYNVGDPITSYGLHTIVLIGANGYSTVYYVFVELNTNLINDNTYYAAVSFTANADITLDGVAKGSAASDNRIGNHIVVFASSVSQDTTTYTFEIRETIVNIYTTTASAYTNAYNYQDNVAVKFDEALSYTLTLDGQAYISGTVINTYGMHEIKVVGFNYTSDSYYVFINLYTTLQNAKTYLYSDIDLTSYLTNATVSLDANSTLLTQVGKHMITFAGHSVDETVYEETYTITTKEVSSASVLFTTIEDAHANKYEAQDYVSAAFGQAQITAIYLDGEAYTQNAIIDEYGLHELTLVGSNDYESSYYVYVDLTTSIEDGGIYPYNNAKLQVLSNATGYVLDANSSSVTEIGNHTITFIGVNEEREFNITTIEINTVQSGAYTQAINPTIKGLTDSTVYSMDVVDGFVSGDTLDVVGKYVLTINGVNGYTSTYEYELKDTIYYNTTNLEDGDVVESTSAITIAHTSLTLRYASYELTALNITALPVTINYVGQNVLKLTNVNGETSTYTINLSTAILYTNDDQSAYELSQTSTLVSRSDVRLSQASQDLRFVSYTLNGVEYALTNYALFDVTTFGNNIVKFTNINGDVFTYNIQKLETYTGNQLYTTKQSATLNAYSYLDDVNVQFNSYVTLDGEEYNGEKISQYGLHTLVVEGVNDYVSTYYVFIDLYTSIENNGIYDGSVNITANADITLNTNNAFVGGVLNVIGNHEVTFTSTVSNNAETYAITLKEVMLGFENGKTYSNAISPVINSISDKIYLNAQEIDAPETYDVVGRYDIYVVGVGGYTSNVYTFNITTSILYTNADAQDKALDTYAQGSSRVELALKDANVRFASYELNGEQINALQALNKIGNNILKVTDVNGNETTYPVLITETIAGSQLYASVSEAKNNAYEYLDNAYADFGAQLTYALTLNGEAYEVGDSITTFGLHNVTIYGVNDYSATYYLYVNLRTNIIDGLEYTYKMDINSNAVSYDIDYVESTIATLYEVGYHTITFHSTNGDVKSYDVTIKEIVSGILDGAVYDNKAIVITSSNDRLVLNGEEYASGTTINNVGNYTLEVHGANGYYTTYAFVNEYYSTLKADTEVDGSVVINIDNAKLTIDGKEYTTGSKYAVLGNHTITIEGAGSYVRTIKFVVNAIVKSEIYIENSKYVAKYSVVDADGELIQKSDYITMGIDSVSYENATPYTIVGNHTFSIVGTDGYSYSDEFVVAAYAPVEDGETYTDKIVLTSLDANMTLDGKAITGNTVVSNGTHTLVVMGENGYVKTITFTYDNPNYLLAAIYGGIVIFVGMVGLIVLAIYRRRNKNVGK